MQTPDLHRDPYSFRRWWEQADIVQRLSFQWPDNLQEVDLSRLDLRGMDFRKRNFTLADLQRADLRGAIIDGADFRDASLQWAKFDPDHFDAAHFSFDNRKAFLDNVATATRVLRKSDGTILKHWLDENGHLHREDGPAIQAYDQSGKLIREVWYQNEQMHREDGPARIVYHENGKIREEVWRYHGKLGKSPNADDFLRKIPDRSRYFEDGSIKEQTYVDRDHGLGPSIRQWNERKHIIFETYLDKDGERFNGPGGWSERRWNGHGRISSERKENGDSPIVRTWS